MPVPFEPLPVQAPALGLGLDTSAVERIGAGDPIALLFELQARAAVAPRLPPMGRLIDPAEVAALTAFLLGPEAGSITGQQIVVCAGASL